MDEVTVDALTELRESLRELSGEAAVTCKLLSNPFQKGAEYSEAVRHLDMAFDRYQAARDTYERIMVEGG
jgi:hypothetical protein